MQRYKKIYNHTTPRRCLSPRLETFNAGAQEYEASRRYKLHPSRLSLRQHATDDLNEAGTTYEILRLLPYDIDTSLRGDNASRLRYDFTRLYTDNDVFNDGVSVTTVSQAFFPTQSAISDAAAFIAERVMGKRSALFELLDATCQQEYASYFDLLAAGFLNVDALRRAKENGTSID